MIKFDPTSIYNRLLDRMQRDPDWKAISNKSVINALLKSTSEINSETARYAEYLFNESKWDTARNTSSILAMSNMLGYRPARRISAKGSIRVSLDPKIHLVGKTLPATILDGSDLSEKTLEEAGWLKPTEDIGINASCTVVDSKGHSYIASTTGFKSGETFIDVDIMQGTKRSVFIPIDVIRDTANASKLDPYLYVPVVIRNCEDASNPTSKSYFRVFLRYPNADPVEIEYRVVDTLLFSTAADRDVEVSNDLYNQDLFVLKFNNDPSRGTVVDISSNTSLSGIRVDYVESLGEDGNVPDLFENFTLTNVSSKNLKLFGVNYQAITGGKYPETIEEIKVKAPKYYIKNYTAGTKEAYENVISNLEFNIVDGENTKPVVPRKVQVYGGKVTREVSSGKIVEQPVTFVSFITSNMEDLAQRGTDDPYRNIESSLNYYLARLKSPQDTLKFVPPTFIPFAIQLNCKLSREDVADLSSVSTGIQKIVNDSWGPSSNDLDFGRSFFPSQLVADIAHKYPAIDSITTEVEAVQKINWSTAQRIRATTAAQSGADTHTIRAFFRFDPVFLGNKSIKGFKDKRSGSSYVIRFDIMYKKPTNMSTSKDYHTSIFVKDSSEREHDAFYHLTSKQQHLWDRESFGGTGANYDMLDKDTTSELTESYQFYFRNKLYDDSDFIKLIDDSNRGSVTLINDHNISEGALDDYLIYFNPVYSDEGEDGAVSGGWIELSFDPIHDLLSKFARGNMALRAALSRCPLPQLKCGKDAGEAFKNFKTLLRDYVDIYVSMRPYDSDLQLSSGAVDGHGGKVLYIDSEDSSLMNRTSEDKTSIINLTSCKKPRMISVQCVYKE